MDSVLPEAALREWIEAVRLGVAMRDAQRAYFKDRTKEKLVASSKRAETAFDTAAAKVLGTRKEDG